MFPTIKATVKKKKNVQVVLQHCYILEGGGGGERGYTTKFYTWRFRPEVKPLTLSYAIFERKGIPSEKFH